mmetsp:Transcript_29776/g.81646  ORF Transcript_29776/g.81646 Transcript_29776/m.81646 type:complete len:276 (-) Transcript_29776:2061-2888(-)
MSALRHCAPPQRPWCPRSALAPQLPRRASVASLPFFVGGWRHGTPRASRTTRRCSPTWRTNFSAACCWGVGLSQRCVRCASLSSILLTGLRSLTLRKCSRRSLPMRPNFRAYTGRSVRSSSTTKHAVCGRVSLTFWWRVALTFGTRRRTTKASPLGHFAPCARRRTSQPSGEQPPAAPLRQSLLRRLGSHWTSSALWAAPCLGNPFLSFVGCGVVPFRRLQHIHSTPVWKGFPRRSIWPLTQRHGIKLSGWMTASFVTTTAVWRRWTELPTRRGA